MAGVFFLISFWIHYPGLVPNYYNDILTIAGRGGVSEGLVPYVDYGLEYPSLIGITIYAASQWANVFGYYFTISAVLFGFMLAAVYSMHRILIKLNQPLHRITYYVIFTPTLIYFSIFSFDWMGIGLLLLSILFSYNNKAHLSGIFMGLSVAARIIPIVCLPFIMREFKTWRERAIFLGAAGAAWIAPNIYFMVTNFDGFLYPYLFQSGWGVENSWMIIFGQFPSFRQLLSIGLLIELIVLIFFWKRRFSVAEGSLLSMIAFMLTTYKFPPQYMIMLNPLFGLNRTNYVLFMTANMLNVMIILLLFTPTFSAGNFLQLTSPIQWIAIARQAVLIPLFISLFRTPKAASDSPPAEGSGTSNTQ
jgi:hypothetical protein